jgi:hypothetical protein
MHNQFPLPVFSKLSFDCQVTLSRNKGKLVNHDLSVSVSSSRKKRRIIPKLKKYRGFIPSAERLAERSILGQ